MKRWWVYLCLLFLASAGYGALPEREMTGRVIRVSDGDTIVLLIEENGQKVQEKIRLSGIDAPESRQAYGQRSRQNLSELVFGRDVKILYRNRDQYGRIVGTVWLDGKDVNLQQIEAGLAWHYLFFAKELTHYAEAEKKARSLKLGLWADSKAQPPWEYRKQEKAKRRKK